MSLKDSGELQDNMTFYEFCNDGGRPSYVWNQWIKGYGPADEDVYPAMSSVSENCVMTENMETEHIRSLASVKAVEDDKEAVKAEIMGKGAVFAQYYSYPLYYNDFANERGDSTYYMPYSVESKNHAISIVGWDDDPDEEESENDEPGGSEETVKPFIPTVTEQEKSDHAETRDRPYEAVYVDDDGDPEESDEGSIYHGKDGRYPAGLRIQIVIKDAKVKKYKIKTVKFKGVTYTIKGKKATVKRVETKRKKIKIPACIKYKGRKYPVTKIAKRVFQGNRYVRHIVIGRNIQSIGKETFEGCIRLKKITLKA